MVIIPVHSGSGPYLSCRRQAMHGERTSSFRGPLYSGFVPNSNPCVFLAIRFPMAYDGQRKTGSGGMDEMEGRNSLDQARDAVLKQTLKPWEMNSLGCRYKEKGDLERAASWFRKAADLGDSLAQYNLGVCYSNGQGVEKDETRAFFWFQKAAEQGLAGAQFNLGVYYDKGKGVEKDEAKAVSWYRKAAEQGHAGAQFNLGVSFLEGSGTKQSLSSAVTWLEKAAGSDDKDTAKKAGTALERARKELYSRTYDARDISVEITGIITAVLLPALTFLFLWLGAGRSGKYPVPELVGILLTIVSIGGIFITGCLSFAMFTKSLIKTGIPGGILGVIGALVVVTCVGGYPVIRKIVPIYAIAVAVILLIAAIVKKTRKLEF